MAVALFNRGETPAKVAATFAELGVTGTMNATDVWAEQSFGTLDGGVGLGAEVEPHGVVLVILEPA
jgi:hypothetical protein